MNTTATAAPSISFTAEQIAVFDKALDAEQAVRVTSTVIAFRGVGVSDYSANRQDASLTADKARLDTLVTAILDAGWGTEYGQYRKR